MQAVASHRGEMSQGRGMADRHQKPVVDPVAQRSKRAFNALSASAIGLVAAVIACLAFLPIDAVAFVVGYSLFIASIMIEVIFAAIKHPDPKDESEHG